VPACVRACVRPCVCFCAAKRGGLGVRSVCVWLTRRRPGQYMARCVERPAYEKAFGPGAARARGYVAAQGGGGAAAPKKTFGLF
jgi:hypothetical protein